MPNRYIREDAIESEALNSVSWQAEVFYRRLLNRVDDFGRFTANKSLLRASIFPLQLDKVRDSDIPRLLAECETAGLLFVYSADGKQWLVINKWEQGRAATSKIPQPPADICEQMKTFVYGCKRMFADAPDSDSDSDSDNDSDSDPDNKGVLGKSASQLRAEKLFRKRETTPWDKSEARAWKDAKATVEATSEEEWTALEQFYGAQEVADRPLYRRRNLATLLNNWSGEITKAKAWQANRSRYEGAF